MISLKIVRLALLLLPNKYNASLLARLSVLFLIIVNSNVLAKITWSFAQKYDVVLFSSSPHRINNETINIVMHQNKSRPAIASVDLFGFFENNQYKKNVLPVGESRLNVTVTGVVYSDILEKNIFIIEKNGKQNSYTIGDAISGTNAVIRKIEPQKIIVERVGSFESLSFE